MTSPLAHLIASLIPERLEVNLFRGQSHDPGWGRLYGGLVLAQALASAEATVSESQRSTHSLHAYFLRAGDPDVPVIYQVDPIRDGRSFSTRRVVAIQHGKAILNLSASFQREEHGLTHQAARPSAPGPDGLPSLETLTRKLIARLPKGIAERYASGLPIEIRPVQLHDPTNPRTTPPHRKVWYRATEALPDDPALHQRLLAWASDSHFLETALQPHGASWLTPGIQLASLDHAMWFHRPFRMDQWLLYVVDSPSVCHSRGLVRGQFYTEDGVLVASTTQEGLIRDRRQDA
jgi:acyl-CoA thioesterase-2